MYVCISHLVCIYCTYTCENMLFFVLFVASRVSCSSDDFHLGYIIYQQRFPEGGTPFPTAYNMIEVAIEDWYTSIYQSSWYVPCMYIYVHIEGGTPFPPAYDMIEVAIRDWYTSIYE